MACMLCVTRTVPSMVDYKRVIDKTSEPQSWSAYIISSEPRPYPATNLQVKIFVKVNCAGHIAYPRGQLRQPHGIS